MTAAATSRPLWPAPYASSPVHASVPLPGSKSVTNRALVIAALSDHASLVRRPLRARDTLLMAAGLRALGVDVADQPDGSWQVAPGDLRGPTEVQCGLAGTVMRFLPPVAALATGAVRFDGDSRARQRPLRPLIDALRVLGGDVDDGARGRLPLTVHGRGGVTGGPVTLDASASSQFVSALLLAGARFERGVTIRHEGPPMPSAPHVEMTLSMLQGAGALVDCPAPGIWGVRRGPLDAGDLLVEPDLSSALPFLAAAAVTGGRVTVPDWPRSSLQPGHQAPYLLEQMGARRSQDAAGLTLSGSGWVSGLDADLREHSELVPVLAAVAALAGTPSTLRGIGHMRGHETDRLAALAKEINSLGGDVTETEDGLRIRPRPLHGGVFATYDDHRLAMAGAVLGLAVPGVAVVDVATTAKTLPGFVQLWGHMLGGMP